MDYAGRDFRNIRYIVDRPLSDEERRTRYQQKVPSDAEPMDFLSVIKLNSTYIDLVDRWYPITGFNVWFSTCLMLFGVFAASIALWGFFFAPIEDEAAARWFLLLLIFPLGLAFAALGILGVRSESFRWTHYPMRLNRKTRHVHVFRQDGTVLTVPWDDLFIALGSARSPMTGTTYDLRAHVVDADGKTVRESFSLGYAFLGDERSIDKFWAFLQPYMEAPDGVERTYKHLHDGLLMPLDGRKEGWRWSIVRTFAPAWPYPWSMLLLCIPLGLNAVGRMFAMATSKQPHWPEEIEAANVIEPHDPYQLTWRDNGPLGWWEFYWPLLCTVLGVSIFVGALIWMSVQGALGLM